MNVLSVLGSVETTAFYIALVSDIVLLLILAVALVAALVLTRKVSSVLGSSQRVVKSMEEGVKPAAVASRVASGFRKAGKTVPAAGGGGLKVLPFGIVTLLVGGGVLALIKYLQGLSNGGRNNGE